MTIIEAYSAGKAVIVGNIGNVGSLVKEEITGLKYKYDDSNSLIETIMKFESSDVKMVEMNAKGEYNKMYKTESNYEQICRIYKYVLLEGTH